MENMLETPPKRPIQSDKSISDCKTPPPIQQTDENSQTFLNSGNDLRMTVIPDRLNVPKAFKYTERYVKVLAFPSIYISFLRLKLKFIFFHCFSL